MHRSKACKMIAQKAYEQRRRDHRDIENNINELKKRLAILESRRNIIHRMIELLPPELTVISYGLNYDGLGYHISIPWDLNQLYVITEQLKEIGFVKNREWETSNKADRYVYFRSNDTQHSFFEVAISMEGAKKSETKSACVLVPLKTETKQVVVVYDHVCPEEHPELFKKNEETGELEYVGDNLFPALKQ